MTARPVSQPPDLPGFRYVDVLGSGGFADVFRYEQLTMGSREVAVKVMLADVRGDRAARERFDAETSLMARLSSHPRIVTVHSSGVATDGRPYLVMEYCPGPSLDGRYKEGPFAVTEALAIGVQLAGAVETMHRANIWHRDIKPSNVLQTDFGPALTDFGISVNAQEAEGAKGLSIPWSPPEALSGGSHSGQLSDVYSLAATVYSLLAGRTPFEIKGGDNSRAQHMDRIRNAPLPTLARPDTPAMVDQVLATAMAKSPAARYPGALSFARALQDVQSRLRLPVTPVEVREDPVVRPREEVEDDGRTVLGPAVLIDSAQPAPPVRLAGAPGGSATGGVPAAVTSPPSGARSFRGPRIDAPPVDETQLRDPDPVEAAGPPAVSARRSPALLVVGSLVLAIAAGGLWVATRASGSESAPASSSSAPRPVDAVGVVVPAPTDVSGSLTDGQAVFTWTNPDPQDGDVFLYRVPETGREVPTTTTAETTVTVPAAASGPTCLEVVLRRSNGTASVQPGSGCTRP